LKITFYGGEKIWPPPKEIVGKPKKLYKKVYIRVPCRSNITLIDFTKINPLGEKNLKKSPEELQIIAKASPTHENL